MSFSSSSASALLVATVVLVATAACSSPDTQLSLGADAGAPAVEAGVSDASLAGAADADAARPTRVLFIGNSYTAVNDLPGVVSRFGGFEVAEHTPGGQTWEGHAADPEVAALILKGWDYVVLQDQSDQAFIATTGVKPALQWLDAEIKATGAKTVLYMTWAKHEDGELITEATRFLEDVLLVRYYQRHAEAIGALVAPVGRAWERALRDPTVVLHAADGSHPTEAGTYLAACVLYATLTGKSPVDLGDGGLHVDAALAKLLRQVAWETMLARVKAAPPLVGQWPLTGAPAGNDLVASDALRIGDVGSSTTFGKGKYAAVPYFEGIDVPEVTVSFDADKDDWSSAASPTAEYLAGKYGGWEIHRDGTALVAQVHTVSQAFPPPITYEARGLAPGAHHVALTYDGTTYVLYVDKQPVASGATSGNLIYTPAPIGVGEGTYTGIALGAQPIGGGDTLLTGTPAYAFDGRLSKLRVYDHALTAADLVGE
jgi:hypothetical protein